MTEDTTRSRILTAASKVFCAKGFDHTTIRDICKEAEANVAAVNYHFGDKRTLYNQVLMKWMDEMCSHNRGTIGITEESSAYDRMRAYIHSELKNLCTYDDPSRERMNKMRRLLQEVTADDHDPEVFNSHKGIEEKILFPIVQELLGTMEEEILKQACIAASAMLTHYFVMVIHDPREGIESEEKLEFMTDFLTNFAIGGIKAIKENYHA